MLKVFPEFDRAKDKKVVKKHFLKDLSKLLLDLHTKHGS